MTQRGHAAVRKASEVLPLDRDERRRLFRRPRVLPVLQTFVNLGIYGAGIRVLLSEEFGMWRMLALPVLGLVLAGFIAAGHDCFHNSLFASRRANRIAGSLWCAVVFNNFSALKYAHLVHHRFTRVDGDSESRFPADTPWNYIKLFAFSSFLLPRGVYRAVQILRGKLVMPHCEGRKPRRDVFVDALVVLAWVALAISITVWQPKAMLWAYWLPLALFPPMAISIAMPEHHDCEDGPDILAATRTTKSNIFVRTVIWNSNFHIEHHLYPGVPSCRLPDLHRRLSDSLPNYATGYVSFHLGAFRKLLRAPSEIAAKHTKEPGTHVL